ncbi:MAG: DUF4040 domain-containing protein [Pseudomonadota bacterium]
MSVGMIESVIILVLFAMLIGTAIAIINMEQLFPVVIMSAIFSLLSALLFVVMDAVDVAFTEAAVGAGVTTVLLLGTIAVTRKTTLVSKRSDAIPFIVVFITGAGLIYGTLDMPNFGDPNSPANAYVRPEYLERTIPEIDIPNVVTAILASYRGFDTLGEAAVVFTAGIGVLLLLSGLSFRRDDEEEDN